MEKPARNGYENSKEYANGYAKPYLPHYWEHLVERDALALADFTKRAAFLTGYYDGLSDYYRQARPAKPFAPLEAANHSFC